MPIAVLCGAMAMSSYPFLGSQRRCRPWRDGRVSHHPPFPPNHKMLWSPRTGPTRCRGHYSTVVTRCQRPRGPVRPGRHPLAKVCTPSPTTGVGPFRGPVPGPPIGSPGSGLRDRHRCGDERRPGPRRVRVRGRHRRLVPGTDPALPPARMGRARPRRDLGRRGRHRGRGGETAARGRHGGGRHRDHPPARDRGGLGPVEGRLPLVRARTGLVLDPYFSATKMAWLLGPGGVEADDDLVLGTVDSWLIWNLTGGTEGGVLATDASNASRTLLFDIHALAWSDELCRLFGVPRSALTEVRPSCGRFGAVGGALGASAPSVAGVAVSGVAGDQQAALFGQACVSPGMAKVTYGTGSFVLLNVGETC